jgi:hypothetical protein
MANELEKKDELLRELNERCRLLSESLPTRIDPASISIKAKIPFKAMIYREALIWRTEELARMALEMYERNELASAVTLTRACMEDIAAMWYLKGTLQNIVEDNNMREVDDVLMKLLMGSRSGITDLEAFNVLTFVDKVEKDINGFRKNYEAMCEYAHPNWSGTSFIYSKHDKENIWTDFGKNIRDTDSVAVVGLINLNASLQIFEHSYNKVGDLMPGFIRICEKALDG